MKVKYFGKWFPLFWFGAGAVTIRPYIFISKSYADFSPKEWMYVVIQHESIHLKQQEKGKFMWFLKYIFSSKFRLSQELEAYHHEWNIAKGLNKAWCDAEKYARSLSGATYFYMINYEDALAITSKW